MDHKDTFSIIFCRQLKLEEQKKYIVKFFIPCTNGDHVVINYKNNTISCLTLSMATICDVYFNRLNPDLKQFYFFEFADIKDIINDHTKTLFVENSVNIGATYMAIENKNTIKKFLAVQDKDIFTSLGEFYEEYKKNSVENNLTKKEFHAEMKTLGIPSIRSNKILRIKISLEKLKNILIDKIEMNL